MSDVTSIDNNFCLDLWQKQKVHEQWQSRKAPLFILHDGPPYANGDIHIGHALNKIFKDAINKFKAMEGYAVDFIAGWDCKGLPVESKAEQRFASEGLKRQQISADTLRARCREIATHYIGRQKKSFESMGITMNPRIYTTMDHKNELSIVRVLHDLAKTGLMHRDFKPIMWSCEEGTSLASAEIEYQDKKSTCIYVIFRITEAANSLLQNALIPIWTTTPWTLPMNQAIAYNPDFEYLLLDTDKGRMIVAASLLEQFKKDTKHHIDSILVLQTLNGDVLNGIKYTHPLQINHAFYKLVPSSHVLSDMGTGFVHIAPDHGEDDFHLGRAHGLKCLDYIDSDGHFTQSATELPDFLKGRFYADVENDMIRRLTDVGHIIGINRMTHSYPHSWRSRKPLIYRATKQWFINLRNKDLNLIDRTHNFAESIKWIPEKSQNRFVSILNSRSEWCISRQRAWGTPIPLFYENDNLIVDETTLNKTMAYLDEYGVDAWWSKDAHKAILGANGLKYEKISDIIDVWIESGATFLFLPEHIKQHGIDIIFEGSDQHRAWFQSGRFINALYSNESIVRAIKTHGYVTDIQGRKMSKSLGNGVEPNELIEGIGPDGLRLWVLRQDVSQDISYGHEQQKEIVALERKIMNTIKFMINHALPHNETDSQYQQLPALEKWLLHKLYELDKCLVRIQDQWDVHTLVEAIYTFCEHDLSKLYFDIRKDVLYWNQDDNEQKIIVRRCIDQAFHMLVRMIAPIMPFAAEKLSYMYHQQNTPNTPYESVLLSKFIHAQTFWRNEQIESDMKLILRLRKSINGESEKMRAAKLIKDNKDLSITFYARHDSALFALDNELICNITLAGAVHIVRDDHIDIRDDHVDIRDDHVNVENTIKHQRSKNHINDTQLQDLYHKMTLSILDGNKCDKCKVRNTDVALSGVTEIMLCKRCVKMFA